MSENVRTLGLTPPVGNSSVKCRAIAREREVENWTQVVPLLREIQNGKVPAGSTLTAYKDGWATFTVPDGSEMRFDLREPLGRSAAPRSIALHAPDKRYH